MAQYNTSETMKRIIDGKYYNDLDVEGFANKVGVKISLDSSAGRMRAYYNHLCHNDILLPYTFRDENGLVSNIPLVEPADWSS